MKVESSVSIIGGSDGPTSVFLLGKANKDKNIIRRMKNFYRNWKYKKRRKVAIKRIKPLAHSMEETILYMEQKYGAVKRDESYSGYYERMYDMKYGLIQQECPELIGTNKRILPPEDMDWENVQMVKVWMQEVDEWNTVCMDKVKSLSEDVIAFDYSLYQVEVNGECRIEIEIEVVRGIIGLSGSGNLKKFNKIKNDIMTYYGVTQEDIDNSSERYKRLVATLSC